MNVASGFSRLHLINNNISHLFAVYSALTVKYNLTYSVAQSAPATAVATVDGVKYTDLHQALVDGSAAGSTVELIADVDLQNKPWTPIANFAGTFDGKGFKISNLKITMDSGLVGLFTTLGKKAILRNLTIENVDITAPTCVGVGAFVGGDLAQNDAVLSNLTVCGSIEIRGYEYVGGIIGHKGYTNMSDCHVIGQVDGNGAPVSFIGHFDADGIITNPGTEGQVGGVFGMTGEGDFQVFDCSAENLKIAGYERVGGVAGRVYGTDVVRCTAKNMKLYSNDSVTIGAIIGVCKQNTTTFVINSTATDVALFSKTGELITTVDFGSNEGNLAVGSNVVANNLVFGQKAYGFTDGTFLAIDDDALTSVTAKCASGYAPKAAGEGVYTIQPILVETITLDVTSTNVAPEEVFTITATVAPTTALDKTIEWTTSDEAIATVVDGVVTAVAEGTATITATNAASGVFATCTVTVAAPAPIIPIDDDEDLDDDGEINAAKTVEVFGSAEAVSAWAAKVYSNGKIPASKLNTTTADLIAIAKEYDLPIMSEDVEVETAQAADGAFTFKLVDGDEDVELLAAKVEKMIKYSADLSSFAVNTTEVGAVVQEDKVTIKATFLKPNNETKGFMKLELTAPTM